MHTIIKTAGVVLFVASTLFLSGCSESMPPPSASVLSVGEPWKATQRSVSGLYHSDRGMGGWGGTCELLFGTYIIKDQMLTNGRMTGEYSLSGDEITFYNNGSTLGVAIVSEGSLNFGPNKCTYVKK